MPPEMFEQFARHLLEFNFTTEIIYSFVIIICALMIYFGTKELYELSSHKGLKYFRQAFLFFALAFFFRSFIKFILTYFQVQRILEISTQFIGQTTLFLFMYFSTIAIFYLLCSVTKQKEKSKRIYLFHGLAFIIALISITISNYIVYILLNLFLIILTVSIVYISHKQKAKKKNRFYIAYILLAIFWTLNIFDILVPDALQTFQLIIYLASISIFQLILFKVLKKAGD